jgi:ribonuclease R
MSHPPGKSADAPELVGTLRRHRDGFGFVLPIDRTRESVYIPAAEVAKAFDGDLVRVSLVDQRGRTSGRLTEVVEPRRRMIVGRYEARGDRAVVIESATGREVAVRGLRPPSIRDGDPVKALLDRATTVPVTEAVERAPRAVGPAVEAVERAYAAGFADLFPNAVLREAASFPAEIEPRDRLGRRDLTGVRLVTIDGADSRDLDDAVYVERSGTGYRLVVAIADVAHFVRPGTALDAEALRRATSVYLPGQVLPMLPERLSNDLCSLEPRVERLCVAADLRMSSAGEVEHAEMYRAVMRSAARCTYDEVNHCLAGEHVPALEPLRADLRLMAEVQEKLTGLRRRRGALDLEVPQPKVVLDADGRVVDVVRVARGRAHLIVEEFMLAANEAVARQFGARDVPGIFRVHAEPDEAKLAGFIAAARAHGLEFPPGEVTHPVLRSVLREVPGHARERSLRQLLLRALPAAAYHAVNVGHYGLAADHYLHFTSPIRRYPDLLVHRLLQAGDSAEPGGTTPERSLTDIAARCTERERAAAQAEREAHSLHVAAFVQDKVGQQFPGIVSAIAPFGVFVELERWPVEGLVRAETFGGLPEQDPLAGACRTGSGRDLRVGDRVQVRVVATNVSRGQFNVELAEDETRCV